jgi:hypothetical protein
MGLEKLVKSELARLVTITPAQRGQVEKLIHAESLRREKDAGAQRENLLRDRDRHEAKRLELARRRFDSDIPADLYAKMEAEEQQAIASSRLL